ncbi:MAG TPA: InlB B-repeat-containing protein, partial [Clostridia bacterium]|nr:InlB B-repeat-containing protein [Clostridia bacterium]
MKHITRLLSVTLVLVMIITMTPFVRTDAFALYDNLFSFEDEHESPAMPITSVQNNSNAPCGMQAVTVTFDANGGTGGGILQSLVTGEQLEIPLVLRTGYTFLGWLPEAPGVVPAESTTYTAQWSKNSYTINFDANGGTGGYTLVLSYGDNMMPPEVSKIGYVFAGWTPVVPSTVPAEDMTFMAHWSLSESLITFDANGGAGGISTMMPFGADLIAPSVEKVGHTLTGWEPALPAIVPGSTTTYTAQWTTNSYSVTFDDNGGTGGTSDFYLYNTVLQAPIVSKPGFTFVEWLPHVPGRVAAADSLYTAQWSPSDYNVTFDANGGTGGLSVLLPYGNTLKAPIVERTGYTFMGWSPSVPVSVPIGNSIYTAEWSINSYLITFDANGGQGSTSDSFVYGSTLNAPFVDREGYTFIGWLPEFTSTVPAEHKTYVAQWSQKTCVITYNANGGEGGTSETVAFGAALNAPTVERVGYTFDGWSPAVPTIAPNTDTTYTAQWSLNHYNLIFNANGGSGGTDTMIAYAATIRPPLVKKNGHIFSGWTPDVPDTMPSHSLQFTATWTIKTHDATFVVNSAEYFSASVTYGSSIPIPANPDREAHVFLGWDPGVPAFMPDESLTFTALWYRIGFAVKFNLNGGTGTVPPVQVLPDGGLVALPQQGNIMRLGHTFLGWNTDFAASQPLAHYQVMAEDVILFAVWGSSEVYLEAKPGSTTVLDTDNNLIFGLEVGLTKEKFESDYVNV